MEPDLIAGIASRAQAELPAVPKPIVIIGAGGIIQSAHLPAYRKAGLRAAGIFDIDTDRARAVAAEFGVPRVYGTLREAVSEAPPDAVFDIAVPPVEIPAILREIPDSSGVLIQKPMGRSLEDAQTIRDICRRKKLTAAINFQLRYAPVVMAARAMIDQGLIGELHDMEVRIMVSTPWHLWPFLEKIDRVEILHHSIHYLDLTRSFLGDPLKILARSVGNPSVPRLKSTRSNIILDYGDTIRANITTNHDHGFGLDHLESYVKWEGTKGAIKATLGVLMDYPHGMPDRFEFCIVSNGSSPRWGTVPVEGSWFPEAFIGTMSSLMRYMEGTSTGLPTSVEDAYKTMALVEAAYHSNDNGGTTINYD